MNRVSVTILAGIVFLGWFGSQAAAQAKRSSPTPKADPAATATITQALNSAGGAAIAAIQDFTASGDITFYWAGEEVKGTAQVMARGADQFRMDANIPGGTRSWAVKYGTGAFRDTNGKSSDIPPHNAISLGSLTFPYLRLTKAAADPSTTIADSSEVSVANRRFHKIHLHRDVESSVGADNAVNRLLDADYLFESKTHLLATIRNETHPVATMTRDVPHEVQFSDYRNVNGVMVPFLITEYIGGQRTWMLQLSSIQFNTGLSDFDFQF